MVTAKPRITTLSLRQFKSVEDCCLALGPLTFLVGRNGAGKSNILDGLRFVRDALRTTLAHAIDDRGGMANLSRRRAGLRSSIGVGVEVELDAGTHASYHMTVVPWNGGGFRVLHETCRVVRGAAVTAEYVAEEGSLVKWVPAGPAPAAQPDRLYLVAASGTEPFRGVFEALTHMVFHNLSPEVMRRPSRPQSGDVLSHDGGNLASVLKQLADHDPATLKRVTQYVQAIGVPLGSIRHKSLGHFETIVATQVEPGGGEGADFDAASLSDGTLRAIGILTSLLSGRRPEGPTLVGVEEPETALHPAGAAALMDAMLEAAESVQVIATCHSPDLLDHPDVSAEMIRPVLFEDGRTRVGSLRESKARLLAEHLTTAGELLRLNQLDLDDPLPGDEAGKAEVPLPRQP